MSAIIIAVVYVALTCAIVATLNYSGRAQAAEDDEAKRATRTPNDSCVGCGRNAGHNQRCPSVRRHRAVRRRGKGKS